MWLTDRTRPDIANTEREVSRHSHHSSYDGWPRVVRILEYLNNLRRLGITYERRSSDGLVPYADADYVNSEEI